MRSDEFYSEFNKKTKDMNLEQLKDVINNVIRKIPENKYVEVLNIFDKGLNIPKEQEIVDKINTYKEKFREIDEFELYFHATGYEDYEDYYSPWGGDWIWEYTDEDNVGKLIKEAVAFAIDLTNNRCYKYAKELFDLVLYTNYQVIDDDGGDNFEISLMELEKNNLININVSMVCLYSIYVAYQYSNKTNRARNIYEYFKNENFEDISVEKSFSLGVDIVKETNEFWNNWICLLLTKKSDMEYRLIKEAFEYNNYDNYQKYIDKIGKNHPKIYIDIFNFLLKDNKMKEVITIGNETLSILDENLIVRNDIALYLAKYDKENKEKYMVESFKSNTNIPNLVRLINNDYFQKYKNQIEKTIFIKDGIQASFKVEELNKNVITKEDYNYLKFFIGDFDYFFEECLKQKSSLGWSGKFIQYGVYLWLLYFNKNTHSKVYNNILVKTFDKLGFKDNMIYLDDEYYLAFDRWKKNFKIINPDKYLKWLQSVIDKRVEAIVGSGHRNSYFKAAILVVALGEVLESYNIQNKNEFINFYHKKYLRHSSFRKELNNYM